MKPYAFSFAVDFLTILYFLDGSTVTDTHSPPLWCLRRLELGAFTSSVTDAV